MEDMEFFQFHPTGLYRLGVLLSEAARGEGGILRNKDGEAFMERYAPTIKDLAPRDLVSRAIYTEIREGRGAGPDGDYVYLDVSHLDPKVIDAKLPDITEFARTYLGVEPKKEGVPIVPTAHYAMGGIPTTVDAQVVGDAANTVIPGLYAAGECACVSVHGANRLGTNSLLDIVVFGKRAGINAGEHAATVGHAELGEDPAGAVTRMLEDLAGHPEGERAAAIRGELQVNMDDKAGVYRTETLLKEMEVELASLRERYARVWVQDTSRRYNTDLLEAVELGFLLDLAEALVVSARARTESRGGHFREDHPVRDDKNWLKHSLASRGDSGVKLDYKPVTMTRYKPMERKY
ncbi:MAG TPA: FAD-binding protein, partial [Actinomycetota bacterium]|nr:FAD-binding protein [Actinomycetota bacterium]